MEAAAENQEGEEEPQKEAEEVPQKPEKILKSDAAKEQEEASFGRWKPQARGSTMARHARFSSEWASPGPPAEEAEEENEENGEEKELSLEERVASLEARMNAVQMEQVELARSLRKSFKGTGTRSAKSSVCSVMTTKDSEFGLSQRQLRGFMRTVRTQASTASLGSPLPGSEDATTMQGSVVPLDANDSDEDTWDHAWSRPGGSEVWAADLRPRESTMTTYSGLSPSCAAKLDWLMETVQRFVAAAEDAEDEGGMQNSESAIEIAASLISGSNHHSAIDSAAKAGSELVAVDNRFLALEAQIAELETKISASVDSTSQGPNATHGEQTDASALPLDTLTAKVSAMDSSIQDFKQQWSATEGRLTNDLFELYELVQAKQLGATDVDGKKRSGGTDESGAADGNAPEPWQLALRAGLAEMRAKVEAVESSQLPAADVQTEVQKQLNVIAEQASKALEVDSASLADMDKCCEAIQTRLGELSTRVEAVQAFADELGACQSKQAEMCSRIDALESRPEPVAEAQAAAAGQSESEPWREALATGLAEMSARVEAGETKLTSLADQIVAYEAAQAVADVANELGTCQSKQAEMCSRIEALESRSERGDAATAVAAKAEEEPLTEPWREALATGLAEMSARVEAGETKLETLLDKIVACGIAQEETQGRISCLEANPAESLQAAWEARVVEFQKSQDELATKVQQVSNKLEQELVPQFEQGQAELSGQMRELREVAQGLAGSTEQKETDVQPGTADALTATQGQQERDAAVTQCEEQLKALESSLQESKLEWQSGQASVREQLESLQQNVAVAAANGSASSSQASPFMPCEAVEISEIRRDMAECREGLDLAQDFCKKIVELTDHVEKHQEQLEQQHLYMQTCLPGYAELAGTRTMEKIEANGAGVEAHTLQAPDPRHPGAAPPPQSSSHCQEEWEDRLARHAAQACAAVDEAIQRFDSSQTAVNQQIQRQLEAAMVALEEQAGKMQPGAPALNDQVRDLQLRHWQRAVKQELLDEVHAEYDKLIAGLVEPSRSPPQRSSRWSQDVPPLWLEEQALSSHFPPQGVTAGSTARSQRSLHAMPGPEMLPPYAAPPAATAATTSAAAAPGTRDISGWSPENVFSATPPVAGAAAHLSSGVGGGGGGGIGSGKRQGALAGLTDSFFHDPGSVMGAPSWF